MKIYVTMTSWKGRINNVVRVLDTLAENTKRPNKIEINLSLEEFPNREADLPKELVEWQRIDKEIFWLEGNTKSFKKLIPAVQRHFNEDCYIITIDDDVIYPKNFIYDFVTESNKYPEAVISNNMCRGCFQSQQCVNGAATLYRPSFFTPFLWEGLVKPVVDANEDDWWYSFNFWAFGQRQVKYIPLRMIFFNEVGEHQYKDSNTYKLLLDYWRYIINQKETITL